MAFLWNHQIFLQVFSKKVCFCCILGYFAEKKLPQMSLINTDGACLEWILRSVGIQFSHGLHWSTQMVGCVSGCVGTAGCHTLLHLCKSVLSVGDPSLQEGSVNSVNSVGGNHSKKAAWVWQGCHTLLHLYKSVLSVGDPSLQEGSVQICEICGRKSQ